MLIFWLDLCTKLCSKRRRKAGVVPTIFYFKVVESKCLNYNILEVTTTQRKIFYEKSHGISF